MSTSRGLLSDEEIRYLTERRILRKRRLLTVFIPSGPEKIGPEAPDLNVAAVVPGELTAKDAADRL